MAPFHLPGFFSLQVLVFDISDVDHHYQDQQVRGNRKADEGCVEVGLGGRARNCHVGVPGRC